MKVALVAGPIEYSVCLANSISKHCAVDFFYGGDYALHRDVSIFSILNPAVGKVEINPYRIRDGRNFSSYRRLAKRFREYDLIHLQGSNFWFNLNQYVCRKVPIICTIHDPVPHTGIPLKNRVFQALAQKISVSQADAIIVHGKKLHATMAAIYKIAEENIFVIPHGEFSFYRQLRQSGRNAPPSRLNAKQILFFGEVRKNKGLEYLIRAEPLISAAYNNYSILIAGRFIDQEGNNLKYYRSLMKNPARFEIINRFIRNNEVADIFEQSTIVVLPYVSASQSGILALAFGFGKAVVSSNTGSLCEVIENEKNGLLVPPQSEKALANALLQLLRDEEMAQRLAQNAATLAQTRLSWSNISEQTLDVYEKAIYQKKRYSV
jgi:glycosyltransferase involved in cell wall biosynthesis